jgi:peptidyl-prolyl cis-trans isomerase B (cyclophilin B)
VAKNDKLSKAAQDRLKNYEVKLVAQNDTVTTRKRDNRVSILVALLAVAVAVGSQFAYFTVGAGAPSPSPTIANSNGSDVPSPSLAENRDWTGTMTLNKTKMTFDLYGKRAPQAVANFISLVKSGFYENNNCHRLTNNKMFVLQCGDPKGDGTGGPGYSWGPVENVPVDDTYLPGIIAMARQGNNAYSMGSQFFIVYNTTALPRDSAGGYTVMGRIKTGLEGVLAVAQEGVAGDAGAVDGKPKGKAVLSKLSVK